MFKLFKLSNPSLFNQFNQFNQFNLSQLNLFNLFNLSLFNPSLFNLFNPNQFNLNQFNLSKNNLLLLLINQLILLYLLKEKWRSFSLALSLSESRCLSHNPLLLSSHLNQISLQTLHLSSRITSLFQSSLVCLLSQFNLSKVFQNNPLSHNHHQEK